MVSECFLVAGRIDPNDRAGSWYREWSGIADLSNERGNAAFERGHVLTAQSNWLRAINYYQASTFVFDAADDEAAGCGRSHARLRPPLHRAFDAGRRGGRDSLAGRTTRWKAISCLPRTLPAERLSSCAWATPDIGRKNISSRSRVTPASGECRCWPWIFSVPAPAPNSTRWSAAAIWKPRSAHVMDYLTTRDDVDEQRIAISAMAQGRPLWRVASLSTIVSPPWSVTAGSGICTSMPS